jgi:ArsR family transcriptional regulator
MSIRVLALYPYFDYTRIMDNPDVILTLGALAQTTRLDVFRLLVRNGPNGVAAGEISKILGVPSNTLSTHLGILSRSGLIRSKRYSRSIVYRADLERFREMTLFLVADCCGGNPETCATAIADLIPCCPAKEEANV